MYMDCYLILLVEEYILVSLYAYTIYIYIHIPLTNLNCISYLFILLIGFNAEFPICLGTENERKNSLLNYPFFLVQTN